MVFTSIIFNSASSQDSSSQASFNGGKVQGVEASVYTQAFEVGNKEATLYLPPTLMALTCSVVTTLNCPPTTTDQRRGQ
ncbi:hypothetical protein DSO57_1001584 [Entomophthora muscae]|uniref:Uncharacterized protein n=1 Tax=Entomophthora muscae TaxID=34485 RepID=A0ACC2SB34_9FUNG|nr:hypothetical protein DSO57_1001584 [Entomophthora muscae]